MLTAKDNPLEQFFTFESERLVAKGQPPLTNAEISKLVKMVQDRRCICFGPDSAAEAVNRYFRNRFVTDYQI